MDARTQVPAPVNEPVHSYAPGSPERESLVSTLEAMYRRDPVDLLGAFGSGRRTGRGRVVEVRMPSDHQHVLGRFGVATSEDVREAVDAALRVAPEWAAMDFDDRAAIFLRAADLLAGPWRDRLNAATMLGQGKTVQQAEIDAACELVDFLRFNVAFAQRLHEEQPASSRGVWNRVDYRPLEGFVYAVTPFNFTAISGNLPCAPALMGNVVVWKPATTQMFAAALFMDLLQAAGLPDGVVTLVTGPGPEVSEVVLRHPALAGIHFTGSTATFQSLWREVGSAIATYRTYPRLVGETGGKDFVVAHPSADPQVLVAALVRGAFEYSGQKCSAASRAYVPASLWRQVKDELVSLTDGLRVGDVRDLTNFTSALIDKRAFDKVSGAIQRAHDTAQVVAGGTVDSSTGWFVRPTIAVTDDPGHELMTTEFFGPLLGVHVYDDTHLDADRFDDVLAMVDSGSPYALTGSVIATDRQAINRAAERLRHAAGNFYVNDKLTGAVVGQQPFGGSRASGTNDKAGSMWNLIRWTSPRAIKEALLPPTGVDYPHMGELG